MNARRRSLRVLCGTLLLVLSFGQAGCKSIAPGTLPVDDVTPLKEVRKQEAVRQFDERRDAIEFQAARAAWERGDRAMCREALESLLARTPGHRQGRLLLADVCVAEGNAQDAAGQIEQVLLAHPDDPEAHQAMGALMAKLGRLEDAWAHYRQAAAQNPDDPRIPTALAIVSLAANRPDLAIRQAQDALRAFPDYVPLLRVLAASHYRTGDYVSSQLVLQQALSLDNSDALAYFLMGCTLEKLGQADAAEANWRLARRLGSEIPGVALAESPTR